MSTHMMYTYSSLSISLSLSLSLSLYWEDVEVEAARKPMVWRTPCLLETAKGKGIQRNKEAAALADLHVQIPLWNPKLSKGK